MTNLTTNLACNPAWYKLPPALFSTLYPLLDPLSARTLSSVDKRAERAFWKLLPQLVHAHFGCKPCNGSPLHVHEQHLALTLSRSPHAMAAEGDCIQLNSTEAQLFKASKDLTKGLSADESLLLLWDLSRGKLAHTFVGHTSKIKSIDVNQDATWAVTKSDAEIKIWDLQEKICLKTVDEKTFERVHILPTTIPGEKKIALIGSTLLEIWDVTAEKCLFRCPLEQNLDIPLVSISPDGGKIFYHFRLDGGVAIQSLANAKDFQVIKAGDMVTCMATNATGTKVYIAVEEIKIWDLTTGTMLQPIETKKMAITNLLISADEKKVIASDRRGHIKIWHQPTGKLTNSLSTTSGAPIFQDISEDGIMLMSVNQSLEILHTHIAPLPHFNIGQKADRCSDDPLEGSLKLGELPSFVKKYIHFPSSQSSDFLYAPYRGLCEYSERHLLPGIVQLFKRAMNSDSETEKENISESALYRVSLLPGSTKWLVYERLFSIHQANGKLPSGTWPMPYGRLAFHNKEGATATHEERIMALQGTKPTDTSKAPPVKRKRTD